MVAQLIEKKQKLDFEPLRDLILVRPQKIGETAGGLALPNGTQLEPPTGEVLRVGPDVVGVEVGDTIYMMFDKYNVPLEMPLAGEVFMLVSAKGVLGKRMKSS